ncbi:hypothetical protein GQ600_679 [Phytophthora cactorum]|nr:hypothetical protein GQ600_679 [Phytophthora cactorum]
MPQVCCTRWRSAMGNFGVSTAPTRTLKLIERCCVMLRLADCIQRRSCSSGFMTWTALWPGRGLGQPQPKDAHNPSSPLKCMSRCCCDPISSGALRTLPATDVAAMLFVFLLGHDSFGQRVRLGERAATSPGSEYRTRKIQKQHQINTHQYRGNRGSSLTLKARASRYQNHQAPMTLNRAQVAVGSS